MIQSIPKEKFERIVEKSREVKLSNDFQMKDALELMTPCAHKLYQSYQGMSRIMPVQDFINECVLHFIEKKYLQRFDGRTSKIYFVFTGMKHKAIDMLRHSNHVVKLVSENLKSSTKDEMELSIYDVTADEEPVDPIGEMIVDEALEVLSKKDPLGKTFETDEFGEITFCQYWVFQYHLKGYDRKAMSSIFGVTTATVGNYLKAAQEVMKSWYNS